MKIQEKTEVRGNKVFRSYIYIREKMTEWLWFFVREGEAVPHFYLPVYCSYMRRGYYVMPTPLAPFGLLAIALYHALWSLWKDIVYIVSKWVGIKRAHEVRDEFFNNN